MPMSQDFSKYQEGEPRPAEEVGEGVIISPDTRRSQRIPPGQTRTRKWPILHYGRVPEVPSDRWRLEVKGLVKNPLTFTWQQFQELPRVRVYADFHCVTRWSRLDNVWEGVSTRTLAEMAGVGPTAAYVIAHGYDDGFTTNLPLDAFLAEDALLADQHDGEPLSADHGGPLRLIIPQLYAWKSAKWLRRIEFVESDKPGYWEQVGYHNHGDPWKEERYGW